VRRKGFKGKRGKIKKDIGVLEYWSIGVLEIKKQLYSLLFNHYSKTPVLHDEKCV